MEVEEVVGRIIKTADRLVRAVELSRRDEKWWAFIDKENWELIQLNWALRGVILKRGKGTETEGLGLDLNDLAKKQVEDILKDHSG